MKKVWAWVQHFMGRAWYIPMLALFAAADAFIFFIPIETLALPAILKRPRSWMLYTVWLAGGAAAGAIVLAAVIEYNIGGLAEWALSKVEHTDGWRRTHAYVQGHGLVALGVLAASPVPYQPAVVVCALAKMPVSAIALASFLGRMVKYGSVNWLASHMPKLFTRIFGEKFFGPVRPPTEAVESSTEG